MTVKIGAALCADCSLLSHCPTHVTEELFEGWFERYRGRVTLYHLRLRRLGHSLRHRLRHSLRHSLLSLLLLPHRLDRLVNLDNLDLRLPFMWKLMDYYEKYVKGGKILTRTDTMKHATELFFTQQDIVGQWVENTLERDPDRTLETSTWFLTKKDLGASMTADLEKLCSRVGLLIELLDKPGLLGEMITTETEINGKKYKDYWRGWRIKAGGLI